jgi:hypothetical protein
MKNLRPPNLDNAITPALCQIRLAFDRCRWGLRCKRTALFCSALNGEEHGESLDSYRRRWCRVYTIQVTDPARLALVKTLKVGDTVAISVGALTLTAVAKCGWFGC